MDKDKEFKLEDVIEIWGELKGHKEHLEETKKRCDWFLLTMPECEYLISLLDKIIEEGTKSGK